MKTEKQARELTQSALDQVKADHAEVRYYWHRSLNTRFAENAITQNMSGEAEGINISVAFGNRHGSASTNKLDRESIGTLVDRAEKLARVSPEDPEYVPPPQPAEYPEVPQRFYPEVLDLNAGSVATEVQNVVAIAEKNSFNASGMFGAGGSASALANNKGLFACDQHSGLGYSLTMHGRAGSGSASGYAENPQQIKAEHLAETAAETACASQDPDPIQPGDYDVVFEPRATVDLLMFLIRNLSARDADEGTSPFAGKKGEKLFADNVTILSDPTDRDVPCRGFDGQGLPVRKQYWVRDGVLERLRYSRYWAREKGEEPDPGISQVLMRGGNKTTEELISECGQGLLVKRLWYLRYVDRKDLLVTGLTRDGLFQIDDGRVVGPVRNLRFNESPVIFLRNAEAMGPAKRVSGWAKVPAVLSRNFTFSSGTESV
ncbi:MAG: TldD/PmbA family protein [Candidatus Brocadiia bacterium]